MGETLGTKIFSFFNYIMFVFIGLLMVYPLWYVVMYSLSDLSHVSVNGYYLLPEGFSLETYKYVLRQPIIYSGYYNSVFVVTVGTLINLLLTMTTAYPLSRETLKGKKYFFAAILFTMIFHGGMIPTYITVRSFGMVNTLWALIIPSAVNVYNLLIMIKFFKNVPISLIESARIDGYNEISILLKIVLPLSTAVLVAIGLFYAVAHWNSFLPGMIYLSEKKKWPLQVILVDMLHQDKSTQVSSDVTIPAETVRMATVAITVLPILVLYPFLQKYFIKGVMLGSVKE